MIALPFLIESDVGVTGLFKVSLEVVDGGGTMFRDDDDFTSTDFLLSFVWSMMWRCLLVFPFLVDSFSELVDDDDDIGTIKLSFRSLLKDRTKLGALGE